MKKMTACILTALLGLSIMNFPVHAQENQQVENNSVSIQNMESLFIGESMFKTAVQALTTLDKNAGPFYVEGDSDGWTYDEADKTLTFSKNGTYKVTGDGNVTNVQIIVEANIAITLTVKDVNCYPSGAGMSIDGTANATLMLQGENEFKSGTNNNAGIEFNNATGSLTIDGTGSVKAIGGRIGAGIGGSGNANGANINIAGGTVFAESNAGAGIGGGMSGSGENILINKGTITAISYSGAGIGGGSSGAGNNITIDGGTITTTSNAGAGIGGGTGQAGTGKKITINGGTITTTSSAGAGIGRGGFATGSSDITITKGSVKATGAEAISDTPTDGNGNPVYLAKLDIKENVNSIKVDGKDYKIEGNHENDTNYYLYMTAGEHYVETESNVYKAEWNTTSNSFIDIATPIETGDLKVTGGAYGIDYIYDSSANTLTFKTNGNYTVTGDKITTEQIVVDAGLTMNLTIKDVMCHPDSGAGMSIDGTSTVTLMLQGENEFVSRDGNNAGIEFNNATTGSLTIDGLGSLLAKCITYGAGIGGGKNGSAKNITINGGVIDAKGGDYGAGIGGGRDGEANAITIKGGTITATAGSHGGAGIGGGLSGAGTDITISGGTVIAKGNEGGAGIGGGPSGAGTDITISGGKVTATGDGAGIGGGISRNGTNIKISGGTVTAKSSDGAGIGGGGEGGIGNDITINGGKVTAESTLGAGIGGGGGYSGINGGNGEDITISGGAVTAESNFGAGIGGGAGKIYGVSSGVGKNITISGGTVTAKSSNGAGIGDGENGTRSSGITIIGGSVKSTKDEKESISVTPANGKNQSVYLAKLPNQDNVDEVIVDSGTIFSTIFKRAGNHPEGDTSFYLYLTGEDHYLSADGLQYKALWNSSTSTFSIQPAAPNVEIASQTASTITVKEPSHVGIYGEAQYSIDKTNWYTDSTLTKLEADTSYTIYVRYSGNNNFVASDIGELYVKTSSASYTITIPSTTLSAGDSGNKISAASMDLGYNGQINVKVADNGKITQDGKLKLARMQDIGTTIESALLVNGMTFTDINKNIATFKSITDNPVSISFAKPTQTNIPAGTYTGTVTFEVAYTQ